MANAGLPVRLSFPKGEHRDVIVQPGEITIGSSPENGIVLASDGIHPHHASIVVDQRGFTLFITGQDVQTHVNARPVREKAILRLGDVVSLQSINMVLKPDNDQSVLGLVPPKAAVDDEITQEPPGGTNGEAHQIPPKAVLRAVAGPYFGKVIPVNGRLVIGRGSDCDLVLDEPGMSNRHAWIEMNASDMYLRDLGSAAGTYVNGVQVRDANIYSGDQIAFDLNRFLIEAPGTPTRKIELNVPPTPSAGAGQQGITQTMRAIRLDTPQAPAAAPVSAPAVAEAEETNVAPVASGWSPWWLIAAGALLALGIALLLMGWQQ